MNFCQKRFCNFSNFPTKLICIICLQTIIATALAKQNYKLAKTAAFRILQVNQDVPCWHFQYTSDGPIENLILLFQIGFVFGIILSLILGVGLGTFSKLFTTDKRVLRFLALGTPVS